MLHQLGNLGTLLPPQKKHKPWAMPWEYGALPYSTTQTVQSRA
jgi:hypothetical protein